MYIKIIDNYKVWCILFFKEYIFEEIVCNLFMEVSMGLFMIWICFLGMMGFSFLFLMFFGSSLMVFIFFWLLRGKYSGRIFM